MNTLNFFDPAQLADHQLTCDLLLAGERVAYYDQFDPPFFIVSRYEDVDLVLRDTSRFSSGQGQGPNFTTAAGIVSDPPRHTLNRQLVQDHFQPAAIARLEPRLREIANECLDAVADKPEWDLHDTLAFPLPIRIICEILGIPTDDIWRFKSWSDAAVAALASEHANQQNSNQSAMTDYILSLLDAKRSHRDGSLLDRLAHATRDGKRLTDDEALSLTTQIFVAGNETTTSLITNFVWRLSLLGLWQDFVEGRIDLDLAINESLRYDPPLLALFRTTTCDAEIAGRTLPAGSKLMTHYAAANRDPAAFERANEFIPGRKGKRILSFGLGIHFCLGSELARLEARIALGALRDRFPRLEVINDGERIPPFLFWGRSKLPVRSQGTHG